MRFGLLLSLALHAAAIATAFVSLPTSWRPDVQSEPYVPLELIREAELDLTTSVPAAAPEQIIEPDLIPEEEAPAPEVAEAEEPPAPVDEVTEPEPAPEPEPEAEPEPEPTVDAEPEPEPTPEPPKPQPKPKPKPKELDLAALSKLIDKEKENQQAATAPSTAPQTADRARQAIGPGERLTASEEGKMRAAVERCWNASAIVGAPNPENLIVTIDISLNRDGTLIGAPKVVNGLQINLSGNRFWKVAEQTAIRAVVTCAPYDFLPVDRYASWKDFTLNFDPSQMVGR